jgi:hypothetical protein
LKEELLFATKVGKMPGGGEGRLPKSPEIESQKQIIPWDESWKSFGMLIEGKGEGAAV